MSCGVAYGCCPRCLRPTQLIWDGTVRPHRNPDRPDSDCPGSLHAPAVDFGPPAPHVHACTCGARWDENVNEAQS